MHALNVNNYDTNEKVVSRQFFASNKKTNTHTHDQRTITTTTTDQYDDLSARYYYTTITIPQLYKKV